MFSLASAAGMLSTLIKPKLDEPHRQQLNAATVLSAEFTIPPYPGCQQSDSLLSIADVPKMTILAKFNGRDMDGLAGSTGHSVDCAAEEVAESVQECPDEQNLVKDYCRPRRPESSVTDESLENQRLLKSCRCDALRPVHVAAEDADGCIEDQHLATRDSRLLARDVLIGAVESEVLTPMNRSV